MVCSTSAQLQTIVQKHLQQLNLINCITALQQLAKKRRDGDKLSCLVSLLGRAADLFARDTAQPRHVATALWAASRLATTMSEDKEVRMRAVETGCAALSSAASMSPHRFKPMELSMVALACAKLGLHRVEKDKQTSCMNVVQRLLSSAKGRLRSFTPQGIANTMWGLATLDVSSPALWLELIRAASDRALQFSGAELSQCAWAMGSSSALELLGAADPQVVAAKRALQALARTSQERNFEDLSPPQLATMCWALARLQVEDNDVWTAVATDCTQRADAGSFLLGDLDMVASAFAKATAECAHSTLVKLVDAICGAAAVQLNDASKDIVPRNLANVSPYPAVVWPCLALTRALCYVVTAGVVHGEVGC